jgi:hypothetical protein
MKRNAVWLAWLFLFSTSMTRAEVAPTQINFQGLLSDGSGNPIANSNRSVQFTLYDAPSGGSALWAETLTVSTDGAGRFNKILGQVHSLFGSFFSDTIRFLGIRVESDPEMTPRTRITSDAYSLRTRTVNGAFGGVLAGASGTGAELSWDNGSGQNGVTIRGDDNSGRGGAFYCYEENGALSAFLEPDADGAGGFFGVFSDASSLFSSVTIDGNILGSGDPGLLILGAAGNAVQVDMRTTGDAVVSLPNDAISHMEILDEPGIATNSSSAEINLNNANMVDLITVSINIPAAGYVVVEGKCSAELYNTTSFNGAYFQIDQTAGGSYVNPYRTTVGYSAWPNLQGTVYSVYVTRTYYFASPGSQTFRLEGLASSSGSGIAQGELPMITATYYPRAYGSVVTAVSAPEAAQFDQAAALPAGDASRRAASPEPMFQVDLRELELNVLRKKEEAQKAELELLKAQLGRQMEKPRDAEGQSGRREGGSK